MIPPAVAVVSAPTDLLLITLICSAAVEKAGPFDSDALSRILGMLASKIKTSDTPEGSQSREIRSPTSSPIPTDYSRFEAFCHDELIKAGGRPAVTSDFFFGTFTDAEASSEILTQWLDDPDSGFRDGHVPPLFSTQLEDWESFQHKWQWDNRGKYASSEGFTSFLESQRKRWLHKGESKLVSDPSFEATTRKIWEYEQRPLELSGREGFAAYAQAVERRLASHHFTQPVQLAEDPRKQDAWTTWVEYLCYVYWWLDWHVAAMETAEPKYRKAWDELQRFEKSPFSTTTTTTSVPDEELGTIKAQLEATRQQIHKFIKDTKMYRRCERAVRRHELRAQWVLEQVSLIESAAIAGNKPPEDHANGNNSRKRKARDDPEASTCQQPKRKQQASHGDSAPSSGSGTGKGYVATTRVETAATSTTVGSENLVEASAAVLES